MHPDVKKLLELQKVDQEVARIRKDLISIPAETAKRERKLQALRKGVEDARKALMDVEVRQRAAEVSIKQADDEIRKLETRQSTVKNNAEYQATIFQIDSVRTERSKYEEEGLTLLDQIETLRGQAETTATELAAEEKIHLEFLAQAKDLITKREAVAATVLERRPSLLEGISRDLLDRYDRLIQGREGIAVVTCENQICQGCYSKITTGEYGRLHGGTSIVTCGSCGRILYLRS